MSQAGGDYQKDYQKIRTKRVCEILQNPAFSEDDFVFVDNYIKTYFPEPAKALKGVLNKEGLKKVYQGIEHKTVVRGDKLFDHKDYQQNYYLVIDGVIDLVPGTEIDENVILNSVKSFTKGNIISPNETQALTQNHNEFIGVCTEECELLVYKKEHYDTVIAENSSAAKENRLLALSRHFLRIKKMDRAAKEEVLTSFKTEKFSKGSVIVNPKSKVEDLYIIESGRVLLCAPNDKVNTSYSKKQLLFAILNPKDIFNEWPILLDKTCPYFAICMEDIEVLVLDKDKLNAVTDEATLNDLRANCQSKGRLQSTYLERIGAMKPEHVEEGEDKICAKLGCTREEVTELFFKYDPKSKDSLDFKKKLDKFNRDFGMGSNLASAPSRKQDNFSEFATPRLVSRNSKLGEMDPKQQLALIRLRNEGMLRRSGNDIPGQKSTVNNADIVKMQQRLLKEERSQMENIVNRKNISDRVNINKVEEPKPESGDSSAPAKTEEETTKAPEEEKSEKVEKIEKIERPEEKFVSGGGFMNKMKLDNKKLLANLGFGVPTEKVEKKEEDTTGAQEQKEKSATENAESSSNTTQKNETTSKEVDELGLGLTKKNLKNLLGVNIGTKEPPKTGGLNPIDMMKKRPGVGLLKNPNLL